MRLNQVGFVWALAGAAGVLVADEQLASACGGLFCNAPPPDPFAPLPVAQTGENIVFAVTKDPAGGAPTLTAHIQILYAGDAAKFSWVVPVDAVPQLTVGTDTLFTTLANATQPRFASAFETEGVCLPDKYPNQPMPAPGGYFGSGGSTSTGTGGSSAGPAGGVTVSFQGVVGPFESAVISATDPAELKVWLTDNGYIVSDQASGLIDSYVRDGKHFVALRLTNGAGINAIQPIVLTFKGTEPCVPLRLTAIAANPDMPVRLWILADSRAVPKNFLEMKIDEARINWLSGGSNYDTLVKEAANQASGNAFVAEYAGPSSIARGALWTPTQFNLAALRAAQTPPAYVQALISLGLAGDPQTLVLLAKFIPMPAEVVAMGITSARFFSNIAMYWSQFAFPPFDLATLTSEISSKIIEPRRQSQLMIDAHPYLTRLNTFISPDEMNTDPLFMLNPDLPDVPVLRTATFRSICGDRQFMRCTAPVRLELPDGRMAWVRQGSLATSCGDQPYDFSRLQTLPALDKAWQREESGEGTLALDNTTVITAGLQANNSAFPAAQTMFPIPGQGPTAGGDAGTNGGTDAGSAGPVTPVRPGGSAQGAGGGCSCAIASPASSVAFVSAAVGLMLLVGLALRRRRTSPHRPHRTERARS